MAGRAAVVFEGATVETVRAGAGDDGDVGAGLAEFGIGDAVGDGEFADDVDGDGDGGAPLVDAVVGYAVEEVVVRKGAGLPLTVTPPKSGRFVFDDTVGEEDELIKASEGEGAEALPRESEGHLHAAAGGGGVGLAEERARQVAEIIAGGGEEGDVEDVEQVGAEFEAEALVEADVF